MGRIVELQVVAMQLARALGDDDRPGRRVDARTAEDMQLVAGERHRRLRRAVAKNGFLMHDHVADERDVLPVVVAERAVSPKIAVTRDSAHCAWNREVTVPTEDAFSELHGEFADLRIGECRLGRLREGCERAERDQTARATFEETHLF
jgi:hypothetical protein